MKTRLAIFVAILAVAGTTVLFVGQPSSAQTDNVSGMRMVLEIDGKPAVFFSELVGIVSEISGRPKAEPSTPPQVTLRRHADDNMVLWDWQKEVRADFRSGKRAASLTFYNTNGDPVQRYHLTDAWPQKVEIGALKAGASEVLMETVTMTCEYIQRVAV